MASLDTPDAIICGLAMHMSVLSLCLDTRTSVLLKANLSYEYVLLYGVSVILS